jgi:hypothetical protein
LQSGGTAISARFNGTAYDHIVVDALTSAEPEMAQLVAPDI